MLRTRGPLCLSAYGMNYSCSTCKQDSVLLISTFQREDGRGRVLLSFMPPPVQASRGHLLLSPPTGLPSIALWGSRLEDPSPLGVTGIR